jgi:DNA polymerase III delta prime subunit
MSNQTHQLLSDLVRPQTIDELALVEQDIQRLKQMLCRGSIMNMLAHGQSGTGKTTACKIILKTIAPANGVEFAGSSAWNADTMAQLDMYASTQALVGGRKACLIDEVDLLPKSMQNALRPIIDMTSPTTPFLFTANDIKKVVPAIQSRALPLCFDVAAADRTDVKERLQTRYMRIMINANIPCDIERLERIIDDHFRDLRTIANCLQWECGSAATA